MGWLAEIGTVVSVLGVVFVPGLLTGLLIGLRRLALWALAPVISAGSLGLLAIAFPLLGVDWSPLSVALGCAMFSGLAWGVRVLLRLPPDMLPARIEKSRSGKWLVLVGLAIGSTLAALRLGFYIGSPESISQTNDAVVHLNFLHWIEVTGSASSFDLTGMLDSTAFYPGAWHALASAAAALTGGSVPVVVNALSIVIGALVWPLGIAFLTQSATKGAALPTAIAAAIAPALLAFPLLLIQWGVLYPYLLAVAMLPAATALIVLAPRALARPTVEPLRSAVPSQWSTGAWLLLLAVICLAALALSQPAVLLVWGALALCFAGWQLIGAWTVASRRTRIRLLALSFIALLAFGLVWIALTSQVGAGIWASSQGYGATLMDIALNRQAMYPANVWVTLLMVAGLVVSVRVASLRWLATAWVGVSTFYFVAMAVANPVVRTWLIGAFYSDPYRIAAVVPVVVIPIAAIGAAAIVGWLDQVLRLRGIRSARAIAPADSFGQLTYPGQSRRAGAWALGAVAIVGAASLAIAPIVQWRDVFERAADAESLYSLTETSYLSRDERVLLERLGEHVEPGERVIANPATGAGFGFVLSNRDVYPRTWSPPQTVEYQLLAQSLRDAAQRPDVCAALAQLGAKYVLDFGAGEETPGRYLMPGFADLGEAAGFELVDREGDAALFRIAACR